MRPVRACNNCMIIRNEDLRHRGVFLTIRHRCMAPGAPALSSRLGGICSDPWFLPCVFVYKRIPKSGSIKKISFGVCHTVLLPESDGYEPVTRHDSVDSRN